MAVFDTNNSVQRFDLTQALYTHNTGYTVPLDFVGLTSITFAIGGVVALDKHGKEVKDQANARFDTAKLSHTGAVPLPASGMMLIGAIGGMAGLRRRKSV